MLKNVLDGNMDSNTFEDTMREMFGIYAYISFTLDKVSVKILFKKLISIFLKTFPFEYNKLNFSHLFIFRLSPMLFASCNIVSQNEPHWIV